LMDINLPGIDGAEALKQIRMINPQQGVVMLTAFATVENAIYALKEGAFDFLKKPFENEHLIHTVNQCLEQYKTLREKENLEEEVRRLSITDDLTGLYNHRHFFKTLEAELVRLKRQKTSLSLLMFDLDNFKKYNDLYGHLEGDKVLRQSGRSSRTPSDPMSTLAIATEGMNLPSSSSEPLQVEPAPLRNVSVPPSNRPSLITSRSASAYPSTGTTSTWRGLSNRRMMRCIVRKIPAEIEFIRTSHKSLTKMPNPKLEILNSKQTQMSKTQNSKPYDLRDRTLRFAKMVRNYVKKLPKTLGNIEDARQLIKASGSVGPTISRPKKH